MQEILALALESGGSIGHDSLSLCGSDLTAEIGLAGLAELAFFTFGCAVGFWCKLIDSARTDGFKERRGKLLSY